jgi:thiamine monophosphate synthase
VPPGGAAPLVAIGGIDAHSPRCAAIGVAGAAVISAVAAAADPVARAAPCRRLRRRALAGDAA